MAFNPLGAVQEGYDFAQGLRDRRTMNNAGNALAGGDYRGGANALLQGGMLDQGMGLLNYDQRNQEAQAKAMQQQAEAEKAAKVEQRGLLLRGAQALRAVPEAERPAYMQSTILPQLVQMGLDQSPEGKQVIGQMLQGGLTDRQIDSFIQVYGGALEREFQLVNQEGVGVGSFDKTTGKIDLQYRTPPKPLVLGEGQIAYEGDPSVPTGGAQGGQVFGFAGAGPDAIAGSLEGVGEGAADAAGTTGDQGDRLGHATVLER